jgi:hypothetical protein
MKRAAGPLLIVSLAILGLGYAFERGAMSQVKRRVGWALKRNGILARCAEGAAAGGTEAARMLCSCYIREVERRWSPGDYAEHAEAYGTLLEKEGVVSQCREQVFGHGERQAVKPAG